MCTAFTALDCFSERRRILQLHLYQPSTSHADRHRDRQTSSKTRPSRPAAPNANTSKFAAKICARPILAPGPVGASHAAHVRADLSTLKRPLADSRAIAAQEESGEQCLNTTIPISPAAYHDNYLFIPCVGVGLPV